MHYVLLCKTTKEHFSYRQYNCTDIDDNYSYSQGNLLQPLVIILRPSSVIKIKHLNSIKTCVK